MDIIRIVDGKKYDTWKSIEIGRENFNDETEEVLYRTQKGSYFIMRIDLILSKAGVDPCTEKEARKWVEEHRQNQYERIFGPAEEA